MIIEIIRFIFSILVIILFVTDIVIRVEYKREMHKLREQITRTKRR